MNTNLIWKIVLIVLLTVFAALMVYPPQEKLRPGLDLAGGTKLVYEIDATDMPREDRKGLAQNMIPIIRKRIDPGNVANLVIRPQGDTRIEIHLPVASENTIKKRKAFEAALEQLEDQNLNLLRIKRALTMDKEQREEIFAEFASGSEKRREILDELARTYDQRKEAQMLRDNLEEKLVKLGEELEKAGLEEQALRENALKWSKLDPVTQDKRIEEYMGDVEDEGLLESLLNFGKPRAKLLVKQYLQTYGQWAEVVNKLADPEDGYNVQFAEAGRALSELNLSNEELMQTLQMPPDLAERRESIESMKDRFPERKELIDQVTAAYDEYAKVGGRLDDPEDLKRMLRGSGKLEFRILPTLGENSISNSEAQGYVEALAARGPKLSSDMNYVWKKLEEQTPEASAQWQSQSFIVGSFAETFYVLASNQPGEIMTQGSGKNWQLKRAYPTSDQQMRPAIGFSFDPIGGAMFFDLTKNNLQRNLAILLDDLVLSAPTIQSAIRSSGEITGKYTQQEQQDMVNKLNAGSLQASLSEVPISEKSIGPALGKDNRDQGIKAGLVGLGLVALFMILYYLLPGFFADIALLMNIVFILGLMVILRATFTLPGIAGIILTIGMSVDANVLIFERIREEQDQGNSLKQAIANGYARAFRTIFDANVTTFITAFILYYVGSEEIKGFAIVLMLGILSSMFTALFVTRVIFDLLVSKRIIRDHLTMNRLIKNPSVSWMGIRKVFFAMSALLIIGSMAVFFGRDDEANSKYDIEFTGGTSVQIDFKEGTGFSRLDVEQKIREIGSEMGNPDLAAAKVYSVGESGNEYEITTTATNKSIATVTFASEGQTVESVGSSVRKAADELGRSLYNLEISSEGNAFTVSTSLVNKGAVAEILSTAFPDAVQISEVEVNEVVNQAVRQAFGDYLDVRENLGVTIVETGKVSEEDVELADYIGGAKITCRLSQETTADRLEQRFRDIRFKPDAQDIQWYRYAIYDTQLTPFEADSRVKEFVYVSVHPEAGYRELTSEEEQRFAANEQEKIEMACSLQTSLARVTQIDPSIGLKSQYQALQAIILSLIAIVAYIWIRFGSARFGIAAIVALIHDVCITLGAVTVCTFIARSPIGAALGIGDFKINLEMIAAFLTIIGYSLNDTIVVFDRIRENRGKMNFINPNVVNESINQTLGRTLLTSFTTFLVVLVMYIWGGSGLRGFTFAMLIGILIGTYSSIAIASPILLLGQKKES